MDRTTPPPAGLGTEANQSIRRAGITAGVGLLLLAALGPVFLYFEGLTTQGGPAHAATQIIGSEILFRLGIVGLFSAVALDVVIASALYHVFRPMRAGLSMLAAWFRLAYAGVLMVAISQLVDVVRLLKGNDYLAVFNADQLRNHSLLGINAFSDIWHAGLILFGVHLLILGYLAYKSGYVPRFLGVLLAMAGFGYAFDSVVAVLSPEFPIKVGFFTFIGELLLALWLVIRSRRLTVSESQPRETAAT